MIRQPQRWSGEQLSADARLAADRFRELRLAVGGAWDRHYVRAAADFERLLHSLTGAGASILPADVVAQALSSGLGEALRYLAGPPISEDDLQVIASVDSMAPGRLAADRQALQRMREVLLRILDPHRFPWVAEQRGATAAERHAAILASSVLLASQRIETERRMHGKDAQEAQVKALLKAAGLREVAAKAVNTLVEGPQQGEFCGECQLGERKADVLVRLPDTRLLAIECKVSNSALNSVKRLNNDAAVKAGYWLEQFGARQVVAAAVLAGVFKVLNLEQAQERGLALFWAHDLSRLIEFIHSTRQAR